MKSAEEVRKYQDEQILKLIAAHEDIIAKTWEVLDKDVLGEEIEKAGERKNATEDLFWNKLAKRRKGLDEVERSLEIINKLRQRLSDYKQPTAAPAKEGEKTEGDEGVMVHPSMKHAKT